MSLSKNTVGLVELDGVRLVIDHDDYLTIAQRADLQAVDSEELLVGQIKHTNSLLPVYQLSESLKPVKFQDESQQYRFCLGFKCQDQADNFALLCNDFAQVDLAAVDYIESEIPEFMKEGLMPVSRVVVYEGQTYFHTSSEVLLDFINSVTNSA